MANSSLPLIYDLSASELAAAVKDIGESSFRAKQIWHGIYRDLWKSTADFTNLPGKFKQKIDRTASFTGMQPEIILKSRDKRTTKTLFRLMDGRSIEAVLMVYDERRTLCISTQAGCAMGCVFCATGQMGFQRHLSGGEIIEQVLYYARLLKESGERVTNIVVMGMGEPMHNYDATFTAIDRLNDSEGFNLGARHFTVSTVGIIPGIKRMAEEKRQVNLAISLHAANNELRSTLIPINRKYPIEMLMDACQEYISLTHRRISFEWALIQDINDSPQHAAELARLVKGMLCHVNIIPLNPTTKYNGQATTRERAEVFQTILENHGIPCTIRLRRGIDIQAGCGQLASSAKPLS